MKSLSDLIKKMTPANGFKNELLMIDLPRGQQHESLEEALLENAIRFKTFLEQVVNPANVA